MPSYLLTLMAVSKGIDFGVLKHQITVETVTKTDDGFHGETLTYPTLATLFANVEQLGMSRDSGGSRIHTMNNYEIMVRLKPMKTHIDSAKRLSFTLTDGTRVFPNEYKIVREFIIFQCSDSHEG